MKNRDKQRMNRRIVNELLSLKDICGTKDPTPYEAVKEIVRMSKNQLNKKAAKPPNKQKNE
jgi:hypothetical protein